MFQMDLQSIATILQAKLVGQNRLVKGVAIDSRQVTPHQLFVAIKGERADPHAFLAQVADKGASGAIVEHEQAVDLPQIVVCDAYRALGKLAKFWREQFSLPLIGVTGSNGKTTLKNMIASILTAACDGQASQVLATIGNLNSGFGLPLTLFRLNDAHRYGVLEMGMSTPGEISYISQIARPQVVVINNVFPCHVAGVGSLAGVAKAKAEIFDGLKQKGVVVLNRDDQFYSYWLDQVEAHEVLSFGFDPKSHFSAKNISDDIAPGFTLHSPLGCASVQLQLLGRHNVKNALAAAACASALAIPLEAIVQGLENTVAYQGRLQEVHLKNGATILNDAYNGNPGSVRAGIDVLKQYYGKRILVLGDMKELGDSEVALHAEVGEYAKAAGIDALFALGSLAKQAALAFGEGSEAFDAHEPLIEALQSQLSTDVVVLVKGSLSMNMAKVVEAVSKESLESPVVL